MRTNHIITSTIILLTTVISNYAFSQNIVFTYDANGNMTSKQVNGTQPITETSGDTLVCEGSIANISVKGADSYQWLIGGTNSSIAVLADTPKTYTVVGFNASKTCTDTVHHFLNVLPVPDNDTIAGDTMVCANTIDTFMVADLQGSVYKWTITNGTLVNNNDTSVAYVQWGANTGQGVVEVYQVLHNGACTTGTAYKYVTIANCPNSISGIDNNSTLKVYPNPANHGVYVEFTAHEKGKCHLSIIDIQGREVHRQSIGKVNDFRTFLPDKYFKTSGTYTIKIFTNENTISRKVIYNKN